MNTLNTAAELVDAVAKSLDVEVDQLIHYGIDPDRMRLPCPVDSLDLTESVLDPQMPDWSAIGETPPQIPEGEFQVETDRHVIVQGDNGDCAFYYVFQKA